MLPLLLRSCTLYGSSVNTDQATDSRSVHVSQARKAAQALSSTASIAFAFICLQCGQLGPVLCTIADSSKRCPDAPDSESSNAVNSGDNASERLPIDATAARAVQCPETACLCYLLADALQSGNDPLPEPVCSPRQSLAQCSYKAAASGPSRGQNADFSQGCKDPRGPCNACKRWTVHQVLSSLVQLVHAAMSPVRQRHGSCHGGAQAQSSQNADGPQDERCMRSTESARAGCAEALFEV